MAEPQTRGLTTDEIALLAGGLDALQRPDAAALAAELINATAIAVVQRPRPTWSEAELDAIRREI